MPVRYLQGSWAAVVRSTDVRVWRLMPTRRLQGSWMRCSYRRESCIPCWWSLARHSNVLAPIPSCRQAAISSL